MTTWTRSFPSGDVAEDLGLDGGGDLLLIFGVRVAADGPQVAQVEVGVVERPQIGQAFHTDAFPGRRDPGGLGDCREEVQKEGLESPEFLREEQLRVVCPASAVKCLEITEDDGLRRAFRELDPLRRPARDGGGGSDDSVLLPDQSLDLAHLAVAGGLPSLLALLHREQAGEDVSLVAQRESVAEGEMHDGITFRVATQRLDEAGAFWGELRAAEFAMSDSTIDRHQNRRLSWW
jgi:hypothetical protein